MQTQKKKIKLIFLHRNGAVNQNHNLTMNNWSPNSSKNIKIYNDFFKKSHVFDYNF